MKKSILFLSLAAALASCSSGEYEDWVEPQATAQETAKTVGFTATAGSAIDFNQVKADSVQLFVPTATATDPITAQSLYATLSNADGSATSSINANAKGYVSAKDLQAAVQALYGLSGSVHQIPTVVTDTIKVGTVGFVRTAKVTSTVNLVTPDFKEYFYEIGNESGWATNHALRSPNFDGKYEGFYYLNGEFKFKPNTGDWNNDYEYNGPGKIADIDGGPNCPDPGAGFYMIDVDLANGTYQLTKVESISIIGNFNSWSSDVDMAYNTETGAWEATTTVTEGELKFRMNHDWKISWGGANDDGSNFNNLTLNNGKNLKVAAGTYKFQLYISYEGNNKVVITPVSSAKVK